VEAVHLQGSLCSARRCLSVRHLQVELWKYLHPPGTPQCNQLPGVCLQIAVTHIVIPSECEESHTIPRRNSSLRIKNDEFLKKILDSAKKALYIPVNAERRWSTYDR